MGKTMQLGRAGTATTGCEPEGGHPLRSDEILALALQNGGAGRLTAVKLSSLEVPSQYST